MKMRLGLLITLFVFTVVGTANAHYFSVDPTGTLTDLSVGDELAININFINESDESIWIDIWDVSFKYDSNELTPVTESNGPITGYKIDYYYGSELSNSIDEEGGYNVNGANLSSWDEIGAGKTATLATVYFTVVDVISDGESDLSWTGLYSGFWEIGIFNATEGSSVLQYMDGADGPDVSAVPIPGAIWLMISGLMTAFGIRRRNK